MDDTQHPSGTSMDTNPISTGSQAFPTTSIAQDNRDPTTSEKSTENTTAEKGIQSNVNNEIKVKTASPEFGSPVSDSHALCVY